MMSQYPYAEREGVQEVLLGQFIIFILSVVTLMTPQNHGHIGKVT